MLILAEFLDRCLQVAVAQAALKNYPLIIDRSVVSHSVYLNVQRGDFWYGLRISDHLPAYDSSTAYQQLILSPYINEGSVEKSWLAQCRLIVQKFVDQGSTVVADPAEIKEAIIQAGLDARSMDQQHSGLFSNPTALEISAIRYRLHQRAKWSYDIVTAQ